MGQAEGAGGALLARRCVTVEGGPPHPSSPPPLLPHAAPSFPPPLLPHAARLMPVAHTASSCPIIRERPAAGPDRQPQDARPQRCPLRAARAAGALPLATVASCRISNVIYICLLSVPMDDCPSPYPPHLSSSSLSSFACLSLSSSFFGWSVVVRVDHGELRRLPRERRVELGQDDDQEGQAQRVHRLHLQEEEEGGRHVHACGLQPAVAWG